MPQLSTAELAQQGDAKAIADLLSQSLLPFEIAVDANLVDGCLFLHLISIQVMDQIKLMAMVRAEIDPLQITSITKVKVHGWRKDPVIHERRLFWTEQFKLEPSENSSLQANLSDHHPASDQIATVQESPVGLNSRDVETPRSNSTDSEIPMNGNAIGASRANKLNSNPSPKSGTWQLILLGLSIVVLGLAIGIVIRVFTAKSTNSPPVPLTNNTTTQPVQTAKPEPVVNPEPNTGSEIKITLEKFNQVKTDMSLQTVQEIIGSQGKLIAESKLGDVTGQVYSWKNPKGSNAIIEFKNNKVVAKAQAGL
jgi:hypothetical protein